METVDLSRYLDPQRKGHLLPRTLLTGKQFAEASRLGLKNYKGISLGLAATVRDPLSTKALRAEAPAELRQALAQAEARYHEAETVCEQSRDAFERSMSERATFSRSMSGSTLTDAGNERQRELTIKLQAAERDFRAAQDAVSECRVERLHAASALDGWARAESLRRTSEAEQARAEARRPKSAPLSERLLGIKRKLSAK